MLPLSRRPAGEFERLPSLPPGFKAPCLKTAKPAKTKNTPSRHIAFKFTLTGQRVARKHSRQICAFDFYPSRRRHRLPSGTGTAVGGGLRNSTGQVLAVCAAAGGVLGTRASGSQRCSGESAWSCPGDTGQGMRCRHPALRLGRVRALPEGPQDTPPACPPRRLTQWRCTLTKCSGAIPALPKVLRRPGHADVTLPECVQPTNSCVGAGLAWESSLPPSSRPRISSPCRHGRQAMRVHRLPITADQIQISAS